MDKISFYGKTREEALEKALYELKTNEKELIVKEIEQKSGLFQSKKVCIEVIKKEDIILFIKDFIKNITEKMGISINMEVKNRDENTVITIYSENNNILIGKMGRTIDALTIITKQAVHTYFDINYNFIIDVGEYKLKQQKNIEYIAKRVAREVSKTKIEAKLDPMNSYERRIVHTVLSNNNKVITESIGEEPNRSVVIKPRD